MKNEIQKCIRVLESGGTILYPTDTVWGIGCDATNPVAVGSVFALKRRSEAKSLIILLADIKQLDLYLETVPAGVEELIRTSARPLTIIFPGAKNLAPNVIAEDQSVAIRIVSAGFCHELLTAYGKPVVSTSANISGVTAPANFRLIDPELKRGTDHVVDESLDTSSDPRPSRIIRLNLDGSVEVIRE